VIRLRAHAHEKGFWRNWVRSWMEEKRMVLSFDPKKSTQQLGKLINGFLASEEIMLCHPSSVFAILKKIIFPIQKHKSWVSL